MNRRKAVALIQQHRKWLTKESDYAIARRVECGCTNLASSFTISGVFLGMHGVSAQSISDFVSLGAAATCLISAFLYAWRASQFRKIRAEFEDSWPQNFSELDESKEHIPPVEAKCSSSA
jgi:hypothetical protein